MRTGENRRAGADEGHTRTLEDSEELGGEEVRADMKDIAMPIRLVLLFKWLGELQLQLHCLGAPGI